MSALLLDWSPEDSLLLDHYRVRRDYKNKLVTWTAIGDRYTQTWYIFNRYTGHDLTDRKYPTLEQAERSALENFRDLISIDWLLRIQNHTQTDLANLFVDRDSVDAWLVLSDWLTDHYPESGIGPFLHAMFHG